MDLVVTCHVGIDVLESIVGQEHRASQKGGIIRKIRPAKLLDHKIVQSDRPTCDKFHRHPVQVVPSLFHHWRIGNSPPWRRSPLDPMGPNSLVHQGSSCELSRRELLRRVTRMVNFGKQLNRFRHYFRKCGPMWPLPVSLEDSAMPQAGTHRNVCVRSLREIGCRAGTLSTGLGRGHGLHWCALKGRTGIGASASGRRTRRGRREDWPRRLRRSVRLGRVCPSSNYWCFMWSRSRGTCTGH